MIKKLLLTLVFLFFFCSTTWAAQVTIAWNPNTESDLAGYKVYYGSVTGTYDTSVDVGNKTNYTILGIVSGQGYFIAVTAYDTSGNESGYSNEISYSAIDVTPPNAPTEAKVIIITQ